MFPRHMVLDFEGRRLQGARPFAVFETKGGAWTWHSELPNFPLHDGKGNPLGEVQAAVRWCRDNLSARGAAIGFLAYDLARQIEPRAFLRVSPADELNIPDARLVFYEELSSSPIEYSQKAATRVRHKAGVTVQAEYLQVIERIHNYIAAGDIYQANYTQRFQEPLPCPPHELYARLCAAHPMPFSALLQWDDLSIVSNSPERFLKCENNVLTAQPIKGTARRGATPDEDEYSKEALRNSTKDRAENVMIVDLLRNDLGRVCKWGSVRVPHLFEVQSFPTLHHLVSTVTGELRPECDALDTIRACFPCGSITGAPKIRAMQIIDELETVRRGVAMGAIGYFSFNGDMDWNVAIRTITCKDDTAYFHVGGGIVADSKPQDEYSEMLLKAQALRAALSS
jgi:para-aminobenzoate synthetase component 1